MTLETLTAEIMLAFLGLGALYLGFTVFAWAARWSAARGGQPLPFRASRHHLEPDIVLTPDSASEIRGRLEDGGDYADADVGQALGGSYSPYADSSLSEFFSEFSQQRFSGISDRSTMSGFPVFDPSPLETPAAYGYAGFANSRNAFNDPSPDLGGIAHSVRYLSEKTSHSLFRLVPWDATGTLLETEDGFRFIGSSPDGESFDISFLSDEVEIYYQTTGLLWDGGLPWFVIEVDGEKHYFSAAEESDAPGEEFGPIETEEEEFLTATTHIYRSLTNRYIRSN